MIKGFQSPDAVNGAGSAADADDDGVFYAR
jgi:hypothetical protein